MLCATVKSLVDVRRARRGPQDGPECLASYGPDGVTAVRSIAALGGVLDNISTSRQRAQSTELLQGGESLFLGGMEKWNGWRRLFKGSFSNW